MYHYTECGLQNVWLTNGYDVCEVDGEKAVSISDVDELHELKVLPGASLGLGM